MDRQTGDVGAKAPTPERRMSLAHTIFAVD